MSIENDWKNQNNKPEAEDLESAKEKSRLELCKKMEQTLSEYASDLERFSLSTASKKRNGFGSTGPVMKNNEYDSDPRYKAGYELHNVDLTKERKPNGKNGYVYFKPGNYVTFTGYLGRCLHTPDRPVNGFYVSVKFKKDAAHTQAIISSIKDTFDTLEPYDSEGQDISLDEQRLLIKQDLRNIAKEGLPILEAFKDTAERFKTGGDISINDLIQEYKEILEKE